MAFDETAARRHIEQSAATIAGLSRQAAQVSRIAAAVADRVHAGGVVYTCGNGGSAAEAMHLAEELIGRYRAPRPPLPAVCLNADATALTCIANDFGFDHVFERQARALCRRGDALIAFSTSGKSPNIVLALKAAREAGALAIGLLGRGGGDAAANCDMALVVESDDTARIQEAHQVVLHIMLEAVESACSS